MQFNCIGISNNFFFSIAISYSYQAGADSGRGGRGSPPSLAVSKCTNYIIYTYIHIYRLSIPPVNVGWIRAWYQDNNNYYKAYEI